jgi:hypothetical protein
MSATKSVFNHFPTFCREVLKQPLSLPQEKLFDHMLDVAKMCEPCRKKIMDFMLSGRRAMTIKCHPSHRREWSYTCEGCGKHSDEAKGWRMDLEDSIWLCKRCQP